MKEKRCCTGVPAVAMRLGCNYTAQLSGVKAGSRQSALVGRDKTAETCTQPDETGDAGGTFQSQPGTCGHSLEDGKTQKIANLSFNSFW